MNWILGTLAVYAVSQGEVLRIGIDAEPGLIGGAAQFESSDLPLTRSGDDWTAIFGIDLEMTPGHREAKLSLRYADGSERTLAEDVHIVEREFPTTRLTVAERYVELAPEDQARAARESAEIAAIYDTVSPRRYWEEAFRSPLSGISGGRNFGHRRVFNDQPRAPHSGADLAASTGTSISSSNAGRVVLAKDLFFSGNAVFVDHGLGLYSVYLHLSRIDVEVGEVVAPGQIIGLVGATGRVTGPHLHWGVRILGARIDPFSLLDMIDD
jgi:murein DD-endopeptidase MepM/ murein hydrolase activator NlpD